jgi:Ser/Thr protein kinase RdoA (MazF antagonist)
VPLELARSILEAFRVGVLQDFGGERNHHWLVQRGTERLVLRRWGNTGLEWETELLERVHGLGHPVPRVLETCTDESGTAWSLHPHLPGQPATDKNSPREQRNRGRLLAEFHRSLETLSNVPQRPGWRRCEAILSDASLEQTFLEHAATDAEEANLYLWYLERARVLLAGLEPALRPSQVVHGDFTQWNLLFSGERLTGILDFELAHADHRIADFALAWRGIYDDVIHAYDEVSPLEEVEWALLTPLWWASLLEGAAKNVRAGGRDDGWTVKMLLRRSVLMRDAAMYTLAP